MYLEDDNEELEAREGVESEDARSLRAAAAVSCQRCRGAITFSGLKGYIPVFLNAEIIVPDIRAFSRISL